MPNENNNLEVLDILTIISFVIGLQSFDIAQKNLIENRQQTEDTQKILDELNYHLAQQDDILEKQNQILYELNGKE